MASPIRFLCEHTPSRSRVFALDNQHHLEYLQALVTNPDPIRAERLTALLNRILAVARVAAGSEPDTLSGDIGQLKSAVDAELRGMPAAAAASVRQAVHHVTQESWPDNPAAPNDVYTPDWAFLFPKVSLSSTSDADDDGPVLTARSAAWLYDALLVMADWADDVVDDLQHTEGLKALHFDRKRQLMDDAAIPVAMHSQSLQMLQRYAMGYRWLAEDLAWGRYPVPSTMAEEMALDRALDWLDEEFLKPESRAELLSDVSGQPEDSADQNLFEYGREALFQDRDFEGVLEQDEPLDEPAYFVFDAFANVPTRT